MHDSIGDRMKRYEEVSKTKLVQRMPVIIRLDGKAFHTFTRGFHKPFDGLFSAAMSLTTLELCKNIQGCVLGYTQSDEITLILQDYKEITTDRWFDYEVQKICSVAASIATLAFNRAFKNCYDTMISVKNDFGMTPKDIANGIQSYNSAISKGGFFDCRCFNVPKEDVCNCLIWRQQDATRNSIQSVAQANFSTKEMFKKNCNQLQDMLMIEKGINWNDTPTKYKRGLCIIKNDEGQWEVDEEIPIFTQDRNYIEKLIIF